MGDPVSQEVSPLPVAAAKNGFTPAQAADAHAHAGLAELLKAQDPSLFQFINLSEMLPSTVIARGGPSIPLEAAPNSAVGRLRLKTDQGELSLEEYLVHPKSRAQGLLVIHRGKIAFERYPGMREFDNHVWMSCAKTLVSLVIAIEESDGLIDLQRPVDAYLPQLSQTAWSGIPIYHLLHMASGLDLEENETNRGNIKSLIVRMFLAECGQNNADGQREKMIDVIRLVGRLREPGLSFEYSSMNTQVLVLLSEAVENRRWAEIVRDRIWSRMQAEGDMLVNVTPEGIAAAHGFVSARLRDLGRYGMLYTPSWNRTSRERIVSEEYLRKIQAGGDPHTTRQTRLNDLEAEFRERPITSGWHWDAVFSDGDFVKTGVRGQGLYVSPGKDLVICWHSTVIHSDLPGYSRAIAKLLA